MTSVVLVGMVATAALAGCTGDSDTGGGAGPTATATPTVEVGDTRYFEDTSAVGRPVTITGRITRVITPTSFVVDAREYGDDSVLVLSRPRDDLAEGTLLEVNGRVEVFGYPTYADEFALGPAVHYQDFAGERFIAAAQPPPSPGVTAT